MEPQLAIAPEPGLTDWAINVKERSLAAWGEHRAVSMVGLSEPMADLQNKIEKVAPFDEPVLVMGESGTGKEAVAQSIYLLGTRTSNPFVSVNCPQYQEGNLTVSELFGHRRGSFTGAVTDRKGCFETADGGVIFLDEIGDLPHPAQVLVLRALASKEFQPLGSTETRRVNVRVVAATNRPVDNMAEEEFRRDLFFRLRYFMLRIPPLRERGDDWLLIVDHFLRRLSERYGVTKRLSHASIKLLETYPWPGNVRELSSVVTQGYAMCDQDQIEPEDFAALLTREPGRQDRTESLYDELVKEGTSFWDGVYKPFMERDLNRQQVRAIVSRGLIEARGSYRKLMEILHIPAGDYQKFMDFLRHHRLKSS